LSKYYDKEEIGKISDFVSKIETMNLNDLSGSKGQARQFLSLLADAKETRRNDMQQLVEYIVRPGNTVRIKLMKDLLGPDLSKEVETAFIENYLMKLNEYGRYSPQKAARMFSKYEKTMQELMSDDPVALREITDLMRLNRNAAKLEALVSNPSQTGQVGLAYSAGKDLLLSVSHILAPIGGALATHPKGENWGMAEFAGGVGGILALFTPKMVAKLYLSDVGRTMLGVGYTIPANTQAGMRLMMQMAILAGIKPDAIQRAIGQDEVGERDNELLE
jgi:hypothetical protein